MGPAVARTRRPGLRGPLTAAHRWRVGRAVGSISTVSLLVYMVMPLLVIVVLRSFRGQNLAGQTTGFTFSNYVDLVSSGHILQALINTFALAVISSLTTVVVGGGLAWLAERTDALGSRACRAAMILSFAFPLLLFAYAWILLWGREGPVVEVLRACCGARQLPFSATSLPSLGVAMGILLAPLGFFMFSAALRRRDTDQEEAAVVSGVGRASILWRITLPSLRPALVGITLLVSILSIQAFDLPAILGLPGKVPVLTTGIYSALEISFPSDYGVGSAFAVVLVFVVAIFLFVARRSLREISPYAVIRSRGGYHSQRKINLGKWRFAGIIPFGAFIIIGVIGPIGLAIWASLLPVYRNPSVSALARLTWHNYHVVFNETTLVSTIVNTVVLCLVVATVGTLLSAWTSWLALRSRGVIGRLVHQLCMLPLVFPGIVLALAVGTLYVRYPGPLYGSIWLLVIAYSTQLLPLAYTYNLAGISQIGGELEEAASVAGVGKTRILRSLVVPLAGSSFAASWILLFLLSSKDVGVPVLLSGPNSLVVSVSILNEGLNGSVAVGFALAIVSTLISVTIIGIAALAWRVIARARSG